MKQQRPVRVFKLQVLGALALATIILPAQSGPAPSVSSSPDASKKHHDRENAFYESRAFDQAGQRLPSDVYDQAFEQWRKLPRAQGVTRPGQKAKTTGPAASSLNGVMWTPIGPNPLQQGSSQVNGRVSSIAINPNNPNVVYQGSSGGGVWKTTDGGTTWTPLFDQQPSLGTGEPSAIAIDPSNTSTIYAGTSGRFVLNISKGILKSTDAGGSWIVLGSGVPAGNVGNAQALFAGQSINVILVDPSNGNILYLAATNGLFRSTDGGKNWTAGTNGAGDVRSLVVDSTSPAANRILYAGVSGSGIRQSTDGGQNWTQILSATTPGVAGALPANSTLGQTLVALAPPTAPANPAGVQVIYASMEGVCTVAGCGVGDPVGLFRSTDGGATWNKQTSAGIPTGTQGGYSFSFGVDPASPGDGANDIIYLGTVGYAKSTDSGNNFAAIGGGMHPDFHSNWVFARQPSPTPSIVMVGNDGGIWKSLDGGANWSGTGGPLPTINGGGLQTTLFYNLDTRKDATASVTEGSLQDNGTVRTTGTPTWTDTKGGDGWDFAFDTVNPSKAYHSGGFYGGPCTQVFGSGDSGATWGGQLASGAGKIPDAEMDCGIYGGVQVHAVNSDPNNDGFFYVSGNSSLFQTMDTGGTFRNLNTFGNRVGEVNVAPGNANNVVVGVRGQVWVSTNALAATVGPPTGVTFTNITRNLPGRDVIRVAFDPNDSAVIYAVLDGFGTGHVFRTTIGGSTWADISPAVNVPFSAIALDGGTSPTTIYVGNDLGVLRSIDTGANWSVLDDLHLPNVPVTDLTINGPAGVLRAATFGRGAFELASASGPVISVNAQSGLQFGTACGTKDLIIQVFNVGTSDLIINSVQRLSGSADFTVLPNPATPLVISPNSEVDFSVRYTPTTAGAQQATIRISSNDPAVPFFDLSATGTRGDPVITTLIANAGDFGDVCLGSFNDLALTIANSGACDLSVSLITSLSTDFKVASVVLFPLLVHSGDSIQVPIRFAPDNLGAKTTILTVSSNDPVTPTKTVSVAGNVPPPVMQVTGSTTFGDVCAGGVVEKTISICNTGKCDLHVASAAFSGACPDFTIVNNPFPTTISHDSCLDLVIRFTPTSPGPKSCTLVITGDDPVNPTATLTVTANTASASIAVPPDQTFPPTVIQSLGACNSQLKFPITNAGNCNLKITNIVIGGANPGDFSFSGIASFPIVLEPGHAAGEGAFALIFAPTAIDRNRHATISVTYESDPVTHATSTVIRSLCGEGVKTGARLLVTSGGVPLPSVDKIYLKFVKKRQAKPGIVVNDTQRNVLLQNAPGPCLPFQFHREWGGVTNPVQLLPGSYQLTVQTKIAGHKMIKAIAFNVDTCDFNQNIVINF